MVNRGGLVARNVRVSLKTEEPLLSVIQRDVPLGDIQVGRASGQPIDGGSFPRIRLESEFSGTQPLALSLELFVDGASVGTSELQVDAVFSYLLTGRVADNRGNGLPDIGISLQQSGTQRSFSITTGVDGSFEREFPPGSYFYITNGGADYARRSGTFQIRGDTALEVVLSEAFPVSGKVTNPEGTPLATVSVFASWRTGFASGITSADGGYTLMLPRGRHAISAGRFSENPARAFPIQLFESIQVDGPRRFDMMLAKGILATVRIVDPAGAGIGGLALLAFHAVPVPTPIPSTDAEGIVRLNLMPGVYRFRRFGPPAP